MSRRAPRFAGPTAIVIAFLSLSLWLVLRGQTPLTITLFPWSDTGLLSDYAWVIDEVTWPVTFWLLLLLVITVIITQMPHSPMLLSLTAVTLAALWGNSLMAMVIGWLTLLLVWGLAAWFVGANQFLLKIGLLLAAVLCLWLGAASVPGDFQAGSWPARTVTVLLIALLLQMGIWPFGGWRLLAANLPPHLALWLAITPVVTGIVLWLRLLNVEATALSDNGLLLILLGLFGLLQAVRLTWMRLHLPLALAAYISVALVHLLLLTAVWGNAAASLAMLQLFIVGSGILYLGAGRPLARQSWWRWLAPGLVLAAMSGLPLTVGLPGHLALYDGLLVNGRGLLLLVVVFLQIPLMTAGLRLFWPGASQGELILSRESLVQDGAILLLALGLLSLPRQAVALAGSWLNWLAIFLVPIGGLLLYRFTPEFRRITAAVRHAFNVRLPIKHASTRLNKFAGGVADAFREAAAILEGDGNLLWLLALILILLLVR